MASINGEGIDPKGRFVARPACAKNLYWINEVAVEKQDDNDKAWDVKVDVKIARQIRQIKPKTESFKDAVNKRMPIN